MKANTPHAQPIRMIDSLDHADEDSCSSTLLIPRDSPYLAGEVLLPEMLLEIMAQCFAAGASTKGTVKGYLVGVKNFRVTGRIRPGDTVRVFCEIDRVIDPFSVVKGRITRVGRNNPVAEAEFKIYMGETE